MIGRVAAVLMLSALSLAPASPAETPQTARNSRLLRLGGAYSLEVAGCAHNNRSFRVFSRTPIDVTHVEAGQVVSGVYFRERSRAGKSGWRNVSISEDGRSVLFELFAEGSGSLERAPARPPVCVRDAPGAIVVDVEAWVMVP